MNPFEQAYLNTIAQDALTNILEHNLSTEELTDEQRQVLSAILQARLLEDDNEAQSR